MVILAIFMLAKQLYLCKPSNSIHNPVPLLKPRHSVRIVGVWLILCPVGLQKFCCGLPDHVRDMICYLLQCAIYLPFRPVLVSVQNAAHKEMDADRKVGREANIRRYIRVIHYVIFQQKLKAVPFLRGIIRIPDFSEKIHTFLHDVCNAG